MDTRQVEHGRSSDDSDGDVAQTPSREDCAATQTLLVSHLQGTLDGDRQAAVNAHVKSCPRCTNTLAKLRLGPYSPWLS